MMGWLERRTGRERVLMALLALVVLPAGLYAGLMQPLAAERARAEAELAEAAALDAWVAARASEAGPASAAPPPDPSPIGLSALEESLKAAGLWFQVERLEARAQGGVALDFESVSFVDLMTWMEEARPSWGYGIESFRIEPAGFPSRVTARFVLAE